MLYVLVTEAAILANIASGQLQDFYTIWWKSWSFIYLGLLLDLSCKVKYVLFLTKVLDNNLETVWPENVKQKTKLYNFLCLA